MSVNEPLSKTSQAEAGLDELHHRALAIPMQEVNLSVLNRKKISLLVRRDDLIDPHQSGNKFYKLFYTLHAARQQNIHQIVSFGGAWSNHLYALAAAGRELGIKTIGVVRGERPAVLSPTLQDAEAWGMTLHFVNREEYREKSSEEFLKGLRKTYGECLLIPEGGANEAGAKGAAVIGWAIEQQLRGDYSCVCVPAGTGNTLAGLATGLPIDKTAIGISVLKGEGDLGCSIARMNKRGFMTGNKGQAIAQWRLISGYHAGGYGRKLPRQLHDFWQTFEAETDILLDPVYSLKMFWAIVQLAEQDYWPVDSKVVAVHTGGLQGRRGFIK